MSKATQDTKNNDAWLDNPDSDHEQTPQIKSDVKEAKSEAKPKKLKDLFSNTQQAHAKEKPKEQKNKDTHYKPKDKNTSNAPTFTNSAKTDFGKSNNQPLNNAQPSTSSKSELNKPQFSGSIQTSNQEVPKTHKAFQEVKETKETKETKEEVVKPEFSTTKEGKIIDLNVKEDLYLKNRLEHKTEEVKYYDKTQKDRQNNEQKDNKEQREHREPREYKNKEHREHKDYNNKERKKRDDGIRRDEEGYPCDEDGFHDVGAKKKEDKPYYKHHYNQHQNKNRKFNSDFKKKNFKSEEGKTVEVGTKGDIKPEEAVKEEKPEIKTEEPKQTKPVKEDKVEIVMPSKEKGLKGLFK